MTQIISGVRVSTLQEVGAFLISKPSRKTLEVTDMIMCGFWIQMVKIHFETFIISWFVKELWIRSMTPC
jgi:hypothetical protein